MLVRRVTIFVVLITRLLSSYRVIESSETEVVQKIDQEERLLVVRYIHNFLKP